MVQAETIHKLTAAAYTARLLADYDRAAVSL